KVIENGLINHCTENDISLRLKIKPSPTAPANAFLFLLFHFEFALRIGTIPAVFHDRSHRKQASLPALLYPGSVFPAAFPGHQIPFARCSSVSFFLRPFLWEAPLPGQQL